MFVVNLRAVAAPQSRSREAGFRGSRWRRAERGHRGSTLLLIAIQHRMSTLHHMLVIFTNIGSHHDKLDFDLCVRETHLRFNNLTPPSRSPAREASHPKEGVVPLHRESKNVGVESSSRKVSSVEIACNTAHRFADPKPETTSFPKSASTPSAASG